jgi:hypothetical protein
MNEISSPRQAHFMGEGDNRGELHWRFPMTRLALAAVPFFALAGAAFIQAPALAATPPAAAAATAHARSDNTPTARRETKALNLIEAKGYGDYTDFHAVGKNFAAQVMAHGRTLTVIANPDTGQVTQQG